MCGIAGTINVEDKKALQNMLRLLAHRGPDDAGEEHDEARKVGLGHRRLSIIDTSAAGHQPMSDEAGTVSVVFNGELYNYRQLRGELERRGHAFRSQSDTEVFVRGYKEYGADIFKKIDGMWAIALYDQTRGRLLLSRDPAGIKPLYWHAAGKTLLFASEIAALKESLPPRSLALNDGALHAFLAHGYIYGPRTIYKEIAEVPPGAVLTFSLPELGLETELLPAPKAGSSPRTLGEAADACSEIFGRSVRATLQSDVPVGLFLSGGVDSALIAHEVRQAGHKLRAFTVGFEDAAFDESGVASKIARHLDFPHTVCMMRGSDVADDVEKILDAFGEPFADTSALPTYYVSRIAREHGCKVVLAGDGADELFGGYPTHYLPQLLRWYQRTPLLVDRALALVGRLQSRQVTKLGSREKLSRFLHGARHKSAQAHALWKRVFTDAELSELISPEAFARVAEGRSADFAEFFDRAGGSGADADAVSKVDFMTFLTSSCLVKSDISAMQHGVEVRLPFLTEEMLAFAWHLPAHMKASPFRTKKLLRLMLERALPKEITRLPKQGFVPPLGLWLRRELRPAVERILSPENIDKVGFLNYRYVSQLMQSHQDGSDDHTKKLWALMSLARFFSKEKTHHA